ncbi:MAG: PQQ-binding-like beta-propeller repeat protein [Planctomycetota bacterium]
MNASPNQVVGQLQGQLRSRRVGKSWRKLQETVRRTLLLLAFWVSLSAAGYGLTQTACAQETLASAAPVKLTATSDWPQFRGSQSNALVGVDPAPMEWSESKNVTWKTTIPGLGWSSPVVVGDRVYLTSAVPQAEGLSLRTFAVNAKTGKIEWDREVRALPKKPAIHSKNSHASPTPIIHDGSVFVHFGTHGMYRLKAADGTIEWSCLELEYPPMHGNGGSPVLHDGKLVVVCDGSKDPFVAAVDATTGKVAWKTLRGVKARINHSFVTPTVAIINGQAQVMAPGPDHFAAYDLATGKELWRVLAPGWSVVPQPAIGHGMVFYNHDYDNPELMAVKLGGQGDVTDSHVVWRQKRGAPSTPSPVLVGDELFFISDEGIASCVDARTGERHWMKRIEGNYSASPVHVAGRILFLNETGLGTWVKASKEYEVLGTCEVPGRTFATPAFVPGAMYLRTDSTLYKVAK